MSKRLISMLTAMAMLMTLLVFPASAEGEEAFDLATAVENAEAGTEITLTGDVELTEKLTISKEITINLAGYTISADFADDYGAIYVGTSGDLTVIGEGTITSAQTYAIGNYGTLTVDGATIETTAEGYAALYNFYYNGETYGKAEIISGTFAGDVWNSGTLDITDGTFSYIDNSGHMTVADAEIAYLYGGTGEDAAEVAGKGEIEFVGGTIALGDAELTGPIEVTGEVDLTFNGDIICPDDTHGDGVFHVTAGTLTIDGEGTIDSVGDNNYSMAIWADGGDVVINGGTYTNVGAGDEEHYDLIYAGSRAGNGGDVEINGGTFIAHTTKWTLNTNDTNGTIVVKGGTFFDYNPAEVYTEPTQPKNFVADGYEAVADGDNYVVSETAEHAFRAAVAEGGTVTLSEDILLNGAVVVTEDVTINLNNHNIGFASDNSGDGIFWVKSGTLTIDGEGTLNGAADGNEYDMVIWADGGDVVINGGTYTNVSEDKYDSNENLNNNEVIYVKNGGSAEINGGTFIGNNPKFTLNSHDTLTGTIVVKGGEFHGFNPSEAMTEPDSPTNFVADGYEVVADGDVYTVQAIPVDDGGEGEVTPPADDDDDDVTPPVEDDDDDDYVPSTPSTTVTDENGKVTKLETQADGSVKVEAEENAEFTIDTPNGKDVVVNVPAESMNYGLVAVIVNADGTETVITDTIPTENGVQFTVEDGQTVKIVDNSQIFDDVAAGDWEYNAVTFAAARGIVNGVGENKFEPETAATRGMVMTMLARLSGADTNGGDTWFSKGMDWAKEMGISDGTNPEGVITREQLIVMLWRLEGQPSAKAQLDSFNDADGISAWADDAMAWAVETGLVQGSDNALMPTGSANRNQVAQILMNYILMK